MKLANGNRAYIAPAKLLNYLLADTHRDGKSKARFLRLFGFERANAHLLRAELLNLAADQEVAEQMRTEHGEKFVIDGMIATPSGRSVWIKTVWIIDAGEEVPRFVTARPLKEIKND